MGNISQIQAPNRKNIEPNRLIIKRLVSRRASGGYSWTGGYCVFLVAIEGFVYQSVTGAPRCIQIMSGKCDQKRPNKMWNQDRENAPVLC